ncbi:MAG: hypothetical protein ACI9VR_004003 [Cognaticolwellia sp.]|jgi:hypothetical protein
MRQRPLILLAGLVALVGCNKDDVNGDDTAGGNDTGTASYEAGCVTIDGGRTEGYASLSDALLAAEEGATIQLGGCDGLDQAVEITRPVTVVGPGSGSFLWTAPVNEAAVTVTGASDVTLSGFGLISTRNGIEINSASNVFIDDVDFQEIASTAVKSTNSTSVAISNSNFTAPGFGAIEVSGGSASLSDSTSLAAKGFVIHAIDGASAIASRNTVSDTTYTELNSEGGIDDGFAFWAESGSITTEDNTMSNNIVAVFVNQGDTTMTGDQITGGIYGIYGVFGTADIEGVSVLGAATVGAILVAQSEDIRVVDSSFETDPETSFSSYADPAAWTGGGLTIQTDGEVTLDNVDITGWNTLGLSIAGRDATVTASLTDVVVSDCGRFGIAMGDGDFTLLDSWVEDLRLADDPTLVNQGGSLSVGYGVSAASATVNWTGGGILNTAVTSATIQNSEWIMDGATVGNAGAEGNGIGLGLWGLSSTLELSNSTFTKSPNYGGIANYFGELTADNLTFVDNDWAYARATDWYINGGSGAVGAVDSTTFSSTTNLVDAGVKVGDQLYIYNTGEYLRVSSITSDTEVELESFPIGDPTGSSFAIYRDAIAYSSWYSVDIVSNGAISTEITNSSFTTGADGIQVIGGDSDVLIENVTFTDYIDTAIYIYRAPDDPAYGDLELLDVTMNNVGYSGVRCYNSAIDIENLAMIGTMERELGTVYLDADGLELYNSTYTSSGVTAFLNTACDLAVEGMSITDASYHSFYSTGGSLELSEFSVSGGSELGPVSQAAVEVRWGDESPVLLASDVEITDTSGDSMRVIGNGQTGSVAFTDMTVEDSGASGLHLVAMGQALVTGLRITGSAEQGLKIGGDISVDGAVLSGNGGYGLWAGQDQDGDGQTIADGDCNDFDADQYLGAYESTYSYEDLNCDGLSGDGAWTTSDLDGDGYGISDGDCDEYNASRNPGGSDSPGIDGDCDGLAGALTGDVNLTDSTLTGNTLGGLYLSGHDGDVSGNTLTGNLGYGMTCESDVSFDTCSSNDVSGNTLGALSGCDACEES